MSEHKSAIDQAFVNKLCKGQPDAMDFFVQWYNWVHQIDDLVDIPAGIGPYVQTARDRELLVATFAAGIQVLSHPFYTRYALALRIPALLIANRYADTVIWEYAEDAEAWQKDWADHHRGVAMEMAVAIALICGGWAHARSLSLELVELCYYSHHDEQGKPK
jgi:hypothetical protein